MAELVEVVVAAVGALHHGPYDAFPAVMKHGLVALDVDGTEAVHAAHVVHAVHLLRIMEILPLRPQMWRRVSVATTLIVLSGCFQGCGPTASSVSCAPIAVTQASLWGASAISASDIWAIGIYQDRGPSVPLTLHWDGQRWTSTEAPVGPWDGGAELYAVSAAGSRDVWAVGEGHKDGQNGTLIE